MSTDVQDVIRDNRWQGLDSRIKVLQFAGPFRSESQDRKMVQVTMRNNDGEIGFIQLTKGEAVRLANRLTEWANDHAVMGDGCNEEE